MLNELWSVARSLEQQGIHVKATSKYFAKNKNADGILVRLTTDGDVSSVDILGRDRVSLLSRYEHANGMGFPTFNLNPLRQLPDDFAKTRLREIRKSERPAAALLSEIATLLNSPVEWEKRYVVDLEKRLNQLPLEVASIWADDTVPEQFSAIRDLIVALQRRNWKATQFLTELEKAVLVLAQELADQGLFDKLAQLFSCCFMAKSPLLLDVENLDASRYSVTSFPEMQDFLNSRLLAAESHEHSSGVVVDALSGQLGELENRFPSPALPVLGKAILYSNPTEVACQKRYGLQEGGSFPTVQGTAQTLRNALDFVADRRREGRTWQNVPSESGSGANLVVAYVEQDPDCDGPFAEFFAGEGALAGEAVFEKQAGQVLEMLETFIPKYGRPTVRMFLLGKPDPGRCQVIVSESLTYQRLRDCSESWIGGCRNLPAISVVFPPASGSKGQVRNVVVPKPLACLRVLNTAYLSEGTRSVRTRKASLRDVYDLFFVSRAPKSEIGKLLHGLIGNVSPLVVHIGHVRLTNAWRAISEVDRLAVCHAASLLGLLLDRSQRRKEIYMKDIAFNLGQVLQAANQLHKEYCFIVRNGRDERKDYPARFIGESCFNLALRDPARALEQLSKRLLPYHAWAQKVKKGDSDYPRVKGALNRLREASELIPGDQLQKKFGDVDRAELLLGYLADLKQSASTEGE